jgi:hypothetical protein
MRHAQYKVSFMQSSQKAFGLYFAGPVLPCSLGDPHGNGLFLMIGIFVNQLFARSNIL